MHQPRPSAPARLRPQLWHVVALTIAFLALSNWLGPAAGAQETATLTVTIEAPDDPDQQFEVDVTDAPVTLTDGESHTFTVSANANRSIRQKNVLGWSKTLVCDADGGTITAPWFQHDAAYDLPAGAQATCTYVNTMVGTGSLTFVLDAPGDLLPAFEVADADVFADDFGVSVGQPQVVAVTADLEFTFTGAIIETDQLWLELDVACDGDAQGFTIEDALFNTSHKSVSGTLSADEAATCTFTAVPQPAAILTMAIVDSQGDVVHPMRIGTTELGISGDAPQGFTVAVGEPIQVRPVWSIPSAFASLTCDDDAMMIDSEYMIAEGTMPPNDVTCTWLVDRTSTLTITVKAPLDPTRTFRVRVGAIAQGHPYVDLAHNESHEFLVVPGLRSSLDLYEGFWEESLDCPDNDGSIAFGGRNDGDLLFASGSQLNCTYTLVGAVNPAEMFPTVTCLAGNGRIDYNIVNTDTVPHTYRVQIGDLSPRQHTVAPGDWWRSPVTGRPDGFIRVHVTQDGFTIANRNLRVDCDDDTPTVTDPEVQILNLCRGGNGFVAWQFSNPTDGDRSYIISFDGVPNRSTAAAPYGASVRAVSGRPDGTYDYSIRVGGVVVDSGSVTVACD